MEFIWSSNYAIIITDNKKARADWNPDYELLMSYSISIVIISNSV